MDIDGKIQRLCMPSMKKWSGWRFKCEGSRRWSQSNPEKASR